MPAWASASAAARAPIAATVWPGATRRRSRIPVRSTIQESEVSTIASMSALVSTPSGMYAPRERIWATGVAIPPVAASMVAWEKGAVGIV